MNMSVFVAIAIAFYVVAFYVPTVSNSFVLRHLDWITGHRLVGVVDLRYGNMLQDNQNFKGLSV